MHPWRSQHFLRTNRATRQRSDTAAGAELLILVSMTEIGEALQEEKIAVVIEIGMIEIGLNILELMKEGKVGIVVKEIDTIEEEIATMTDEIKDLAERGPDHTQTIETEETEKTEKEVMIIEIICEYHR